MQPDESHLQFGQLGHTARKVVQIPQVGPLRKIVKWAGCRESQTAACRSRQGLGSFERNLLVGNHIAIEIESHAEVLGKAIGSVERSDQRRRRRSTAWTGHFVLDGFERYCSAAKPSICSEIVCQKKGSHCRLNPSNRLRSIHHPDVLRDRQGLAVACRFSGKHTDALPCRPGSRRRKQFRGIALIGRGGGRLAAQAMPIIRPTIANVPIGQDGEIRRASGVMMMYWCDNDS